MKPKLFAKLHEAIEKFIEQNGDSDEWQGEDFFTPETLSLRMAEAARTVFDVAVESSKAAEESAG